MVQAIVPKIKHESESDGVCVFSILLWRGDKCRSGAVLRKINYRTEAISGYYQCYFGAFGLVGFVHEWTATTKVGMDDELFHGAWTSHRG